MGGNGQIEAEAAFKSLSGRVCFGRWALMKLTHSSSITPERQPSVGLLLLCRLLKQPRAHWNTGKQSQNCCVLTRKSDRIRDSWQKM